VIDVEAEKTERSDEEEQVVFVVVMSIVPK